MAESVINSPNSATTNALGLGLTMDSLISDLAIPFDVPPYGMYNFDSVAKSYPFQLNQFQTTPALYEPTYLLDDIHKFQVQLYQELRYQVARQDLQKDMLFASTYHDLESMSGASTIDTPNLNTSVMSIPDTVVTADYHLPEMPDLDHPVPDLVDPPTPKKRRVESPLPPPPPVTAREPLVKKHTRKHIMARSRSGCWICRIKHLKCDECKPVCNNCTRFGIQCDYSVDRPAYVSNKELRRQKLDAITTKKRKPRSER